MTDVVYTALFGGYEALVEQPVSKSAGQGTDFICFTDSDDLTSDTWLIRRVLPSYPTDSVRSARAIKVLGHASLSTYERSLWIDNRILLKVQPAKILDSWLAGVNLAIPMHDHRDSVEEEFQAVLRGGLDSPYRVREQLHDVRAAYSDVLGEPPFWTALIARRQNQLEVEEWARSWMDLILRYSRRDQLSINVSLRLRKLEPHSVILNNRESPLHRWLTVEELPKLAETRFWALSSFTYTLQNHVWDSILASSLGGRLRRWRKAVLKTLARR